MKLNRKLNLKPSAKFVWCPSLLVAALVLGGCNGTSTHANNSKQIDGEDHARADSSQELANDTSFNTNDSTNNNSARSSEQKMIERLEDYRWVLAEATDSSLQPLIALNNIKEQVSLRFDKYQSYNTVNYSVGCNMMSAVYELQDDKINVEQSMSTQMLCEDLNKAESQLNKLMHGESQLRLVYGESPILTQITDNAVLTWSGKMSAEAKYNAKGETLFWAIAAETKPCLADSAQQCLQVKPISYDDQGLKVHEGKWTEFSGNIEGYQHDSAHNEVIRLQRYAIDNTNKKRLAKPSEYAYVLDTVIESSIVE